ncbi:MAG: response regulator transcription factor [Gemmatimonadaceae bacterium]|nr:response regulator transcription factor [Gemmatimonadaceae bacterium]
MIRVLIASDIRLYREGLALHFAQSAGFSVVTVVDDRVAAVRSARDLSPDALLIDMAMADSLATIRDLREQAPAVRVIALTVPEVERAVLACAEAGIAGYVPRNGSLEDLNVAVESSVRNESIASPRMVASLIRRVAALAADRNGAATESLTAREIDIVRLIDQGCSNKQIAARLSIELSTVKNHVHNVLEKLGVQRRSEAAARLRRMPSASSAAFTLDSSSKELAL